MAEVNEFTLPDLGEGLTEAEIVRWLVAVGDVVTVDQPIVEVETAKATVEVPCPYGGVVTARFGAEGAEIPVGAPLVTVAAPADAPATGSEYPAADPDGSGQVLVGYGTGGTTRRRRGRATAPGVRAGNGGDAAPRPAPDRQPSITRPHTLAPGPRTLVPGPAAGPRRPEPVSVISPLVRRLAREHRVDLRTLTGSGPNGLILRADVQRAVAPASTAPRAAASVPDPGQPAGAERRIPLRGLRGAVADKLARSRREIPDATCWVDADATALLAARHAMNAGAHGPKVSLLALLARICTAALDRHPELNARVDLDSREIVQLPAVHLGFAAQTDRGLMVPVIRDAHRRSVDALSVEITRLTEAARAGTLTTRELTQGTFTLNNYGVFGVDGSTPIINHPEAAMLGVGRITPKPWVHQGELAVRQVVQLSLTFDHRVCDGGTAGGFLRYVADCVEQPTVLLRTV